MYASHLYMLIALSVGTAYGAAAWIEDVKRTPTGEVIQFFMARNAIRHNDPTLFTNTLNHDPSLAHFTYKPGTTTRRQTVKCEPEDLLKTAIGTLRDDRFFFVTELFEQYKAPISSMHIAHCITALRLRPEQSKYTAYYFCIEDCVLTNLQRFYTSMGDRIVTDTKKPAQRSLQLAVQDFIRTSGSTLGNVTELLAAVDIHIAASSSGH